MLRSVRTFFKKTTEPEQLSKMMQWFLSASLFVLGGILSGLLLRKTGMLLEILFSASTEIDNYEILGHIVTWFLYFEFIALIVKYFQSNLHFPLRYFLYIGITAIIRLIILYHDEPVNTLIFSVSILVLLGALFLANTKLLKRE